MKKLFLLLLTVTSYTGLYSQTGSCSIPNYCDRACWDPSGTHPADSAPVYTTPTHIIVHHSGSNYSSNTNYSSVVRSIWNYHVNTNGWDDIGYNWLIDPNGTIYEGRGDRVRGAHFSGMNTNTMGVCLIGNYQTTNPTQNAINKLQDLIAWEATDKNIDVLTSSYLANTGLYLSHVAGHRDGGSTTCPGNNLYNMLNSIKTNVSNYPCYNGSASIPNDNCNDAVLLHSNTNCSYTSGTVNGATPDNSWNDASCDNYSGNSLAADVFYKFTATNTSHTIKVHPTGDLDAVLSLYQGNNCYNLNEIGCSDNGGGNGADEILSISNLNIGQMYWIRIYDYGSQPPSNGNFQICLTGTGSGGGQEDVTVTNANVSPTTVNAGGTITVNSEQHYSGNQTTSDLPMIDLGYYLSTDCNLSSDDILLGDDASSIGSNDLYDGESEDLVIPASTPSGTYFIIFNADNDNEVNESNENNNTSCVQITITGSGGGQEDVTVTNANVSPTTVNAGGTITVNSEQHYSGNQTTSDLPMIDLGYYLSTDCNLSSDDILLGDDASSIGSNDLYDGETENLVIPASTPSGTYYIIFNADNDNEVNESNENNNTACMQITINNTNSVETKNLKNLIIYPNPNYGILYIKNLSKDEYYYSVSDINGREIVYKKRIIGNTININYLQTGIYLFRIFDKLNNSKVYRIIKK